MPADDTSSTDSAPSSSPEVSENQSAASSSLSSDSGLGNVGDSSANQDYAAMTGSSLSSSGDVNQRENNLGDQSGQFSFADYGDIYGQSGSAGAQGSAMDSTSTQANADATANQAGADAATTQANAEATANQAGADAQTQASNDALALANAQTTQANIDSSTQPNAGNLPSLELSNDGATAVQSQTSMGSNLGPDSQTYNTKFGPDSQTYNTTKFGPDSQSDKNLGSTYEMDEQTKANIGDRPTIWKSDGSENGKGSGECSLYSNTNASDRQSQTSMGGGETSPTGDSSHTDSHLADGNAKDSPSSSEHIDTPNDAIFANGTGRDYATEASQIREKSEKAEPGITRDMKALEEQSGGKLAGLEHRLKSPESIERKLQDEGAAPEDINDPLRYTLTFPSDQLADGANEVMEQMEDMGYTNEEVKNTFKPDKPYMGINTTFSKGDQQFEVQFHTPESYAIKDESHGLYDVRRGLYEKEPGSDQATVKSPEKVAAVINEHGSKLEDYPHLASMADELKNPANGSKEKTEEFASALLDQSKALYHGMPMPEGIDKVKNRRNW